MSVEVRPIRPEEYDAFHAADASSFGWDYPPPAGFLEDFAAYFEAHRSLAVFDGGEIVGTGGIFSLDLTVPGGRLPTAGVTMISVRPTHRRQGILREIMRRQLDDVHARGEPLAALWASESVIYGRFGYGLAAQGVEFHIERTRATLAVEVPHPGRTRFVSRDEALATWPAVYDNIRLDRPGMFARSPAWWEHRIFRQPEQPRDGFGNQFLVQYEEEGRVLDYVRYRRRESHVDGLPAGTVRVAELQAATVPAYAALWQFIFGVDLVATIEGMWRPIDEPLPWMLADPRRLVRRPQDTLWVRVIDVTAALEGRRYSCEGRLVLDVRDDFCPWVAGRYALEGGSGGATCRPTTETPAIQLSAADLGAVYLGGASFQVLRDAGRVVGDTEALRLADVMFSWHPLPWCPEIF